QTLSDVLTRQLGKPFVIDNKGGAGGRIAMEHVAKAEPDGHTLLLTSPTLTITPVLNSGLRFDPMTDLVPIALVAEVPNVLVAAPSKFPNGDFSKVIAELKANPDKFSYGSGGAGSSNHLAFEKFKSISRTDILHVPYQGASQATNAVIGGQIDMAINGLPNTLPLIEGGQLRAMFVLTKERSPLLPKVPSAVEVGLPEMVVTTWYGVLAPKGTPAAIVEKLNASIQKGLASPDVKKRLTDAGIDVVHLGPQEFASFIKKDYADWKRVVSEANIPVTKN
ncbi:MAG: tripartite tricarboxylate transporter substrate binding protein, partial [Burkholderiales bacterium]